MTRTRLKPEARRRQLIEHGLKLLRDKSLDDLPVEAIAASAGISEGLLFRYFPTKRDYAVAVARAAAQDLYDQTDTGDSADPLTNLHTGLDAYVRYVQENEAAYLSLVRGAGSTDALKAVHDETRAALADRLLSGLMPAGDQRGLVALAVRSWVAFAEEATVEWVADGDGVDRDRLLGFLENTLLHVLQLAVAAS